MRSKRILLALAMFAAIFGSQCEETRTVPGELVGVWETSAPKYKDCYLELTEDLIIFANRARLEKKSVNLISKIKKAQRGKGILYTVHYENKEGQESKFSFYYDPSEGGAIRFKNQLRVKWRKMD